MANCEYHVLMHKSMGKDNFFSFYPINKAMDVQIENTNDDPKLDGINNAQDLIDRLGYLAFKDEVTPNELGLKSAAFKEASDFATAAQGTKADNAIPYSGGDFTGPVKLSRDPQESMEAATMQYVDNKIASMEVTVDGIVYKGTLGEGGTLQELPTANVKIGWMYKVITAGTYAGQEAKIGDMLVAKTKGKTVEATKDNWDLIPSGDENETLVAITRTKTPTISEDYQTGKVLFGEAAAFHVDKTELTKGSGRLASTDAVLST